MQETNPLSGLRERISEAIRVELARRRMSQRALADATGLSQSYIGRRLTGEMPFTTDDLALIAKALGVPVLALLPAADAAPAA
ncbi:helix-turn-helix domain-containing protein [Micromonospora sp. NPDC048930]|uniref:helix-turn-helix domain-containing protein n=1 Tax=Micromonospora sp. NPDC048930 TaxID=3364261 RepID=UPI00371C5787